MTGDEIKQAREARNWTADQLSNAAGVSVQLIHEIERDGGASVPGVYAAVLRALGVFVEGDEIIANEENRVSEKPSSSPAEAEISPWDHLKVCLQCPTAVYTNENGYVIIWQDHTGRLGREQEIMLGTVDAVREIIEALKSEIGDV